MFRLRLHPNDAAPCGSGSTTLFVKIDVVNIILFWNMPNSDLLHFFLNFDGQAWFPIPFFFPTCFPHFNENFVSEYFLFSMFLRNTLLSVPFLDA
jgi:hypothetical protein